MKNNFSIPK
jgi:hypothetical protein